MAREYGNGEPDFDMDAGSIQFDENGNPIDEDEDEDQDLDEEEQAEKEANERVIKNKFKKIVKRAPKRFYPHVTKEEKPIVEQMKKISPLEVRKFNGIMAQAKQAFLAKAKSAIVAAAPVIGVVLLVLVCLIAVVSFVYMLFPWLFGGGSGSNPGMSSLDGIKADAFYGARMIYQNEEEARKEILTNYTEIVSDVSGQVTATNERVQITITLPEETVYDEFNEESFHTDYELLYNLFNDFSNLVLDYDKAADETIDTSTLTLVEKLDAIKYFGINTELATGGTNNFALILKDSIITNVAYKVDTTNETTGGETVDVPALIESSCTQVLGEYNVRTEKYFIKDYLLSGEDGLTEIKKQKYVAVIFMPKRAVNFTSFSFMVADVEIEDLSAFMQINANGQVVNFTGEIFTEADDNAPASYSFESGVVNVSVPAYTDFSEDGAVSEATSLLGIATSDTLNAEQFLTTQDESTIKTFKEGGLVIQFNSDAPFMFCENETKYN